MKIMTIIVITTKFSFSCDFYSMNESKIVFKINGDAIKFGFFLAGCFQNYQFSFVNWCGNLSIKFLIARLLFTVFSSQN